MWEVKGNVDLDTGVDTEGEGRESDEESLCRAHLDYGCALRGAFEVAAEGRETRLSGRWSVRWRKKEGISGWQRG